MNMSALEPKQKPIALIGGARPNFMKLVPLARVFIERDIPFYVVNAGQHFSREMSQNFFLEFNLVIDYELQPNASNKEKQAEEIRQGLTDIFTHYEPALVVVVGDVDATYYAAQTARELALPVAHVEAGLRSHNAKMREEFNRVQTDKIAALKFAPSADALETLRKDGLGEGAYAVGNIMTDLLKLHEDAVKETSELFYFATIHRAENVDDRTVFENMLGALEIIAQDAPIYLPLHPRTKKRAEEFGLMERLVRACKLLPPLSYVESVYYQKNAAAVLTDSGGVQEETSVLGTPCITMRTETERPITVEQGTNVVAGVTTQGIVRAYEQCKHNGFVKRPAQISLWDGKTAERIIDIIEEYVRDKRI